MQPDGTGVTAIVVPGIEQNPVWSPDGTKIAFVRNADIHVMNADGTGVVNLTPGTFSTEDSPTWSPDGSQIAFRSSREAALGFKIFRMDAADGSDVVRITDGVIADREPDWSPSGLRIAFVRNGDIWTIRPDGSDLQFVTGGTLRQVDWSPSGHRIVYQHPGDSPSETGIHTVEPDGSNDVDLTPFLNEAHEPVWSADGTRILAKKGLHLWTMNPDGRIAAARASAWTRSCPGSS